MTIFFNELNNYIVVKIPEVKHDKETEETSIIENYIPLKINSLPVSSTFGVFSAVSKACQRNLRILNMLSIPSTLLMIHRSSITV